jgi:3,2-trans-enoyl-CoA isomerase
MEYLEVSTTQGITTITLRRGKVNALHEPMVEELQEVFLKSERDPAVKVVILTGYGKFFSFGFDIPSLLGYRQEAFNQFLTKFTDLYSNLYLYPKPVIAAINGHAIAAGCMLALACDYRFMIQGRAKISLNEITFGASVFSGCVEMLRACVGQRNAERMLLSGDMYPADEALEMRLVDQIARRDSLQREAEIMAHNFANKDVVSFRSIKRLLRGPVLDSMRAKEEGSIQEFSNIWYSESTWKNLQEIIIRS